MIQYYMKILNHIHLVLSQIHGLRMEMVQIYQKTILILLSFIMGTNLLNCLARQEVVWAAIAYHTFNPIAPFEIEFAIRNGNEILSGCNPDRALVGLNTGTSWTNISQRTLIKFSGDGNVYGGGGTQLSLYNNDTWYQVKIRYERISKSEIKLSYWINGQLLRQ